MLRRFLASVIVFLLPNISFAGQPEPWQIATQEAATPVMREMVNFHNMLLVVIFAIAIFVTLLMLYVCIRFSAKNNPNPSKTSHNVPLEIIWTVLPIVVLVLIAIPSMKLLYFNEKVENSEMTLKIIGNQWYWSYVYPDHEGISFDSYMLQDDELKEGDIRLLSVDNNIVLPVDTNIRLQITASDVIHNWAVPAFGTKIDAVPGRLNEGWIRIEKEGMYYGQCSELCGVNHGFMPIAIKAVPKKQFADWVAMKSGKLANSESKFEDFALIQ